MTLKKKRTILLTTCVSASFLAAIFFFPSQIYKVITEDLLPSRSYDAFVDLKIEGKAAYVYDVRDQKVLFAKNENVALPLASITKIMTAITAADIAPGTTVVTIDSDSLSHDGDSGFFVDEQWSLKNLLAFTLVSSSNDGAAAIALALGSRGDMSSPATSRRVFVERMNLKAKSIGLKQTTFYNESGLDVSSSTAGAYSSARDTAKLLEYAIAKYPTIIAPTRYSHITVSSLSSFTHTAENTDILAASTPGFIAGKTGFSDLAGGNLAVAFDAGVQHPIVVVVLDSSYDGRFRDVQKLVQAAIDTTSAPSY